MSRTSVLISIAGLFALLTFFASLNETSLAQIQDTVVRYLPIVLRQAEIIPTVTSTPSPRPTRTPTRTQTFTPFPTWTPFRTWTPVPTPTITPTFTQTPTLTNTPTNTSTPTYQPLPSFTLIYPSPTSTRSGQATLTPTRTTTATLEPYPYPEPTIGSDRLGLIFLVGSLWVLLAGWLVLLLRRIRF
jgi:hypothetical protein